MSARCPRCDSPSPKLHPAVQCGGEVSVCSDGYHTVDPVVARQQEEWSRETDALRGSDLATRMRRLDRYLSGFSAAYSWTVCTPVGDFDAVRVSSRDLQKALFDLLAINRAVISDSNEVHIAHWKAEAEAGNGAASVMLAAYAALAKASGK